MHQEKHKHILLFGRIAKMTLSQCKKECKTFVGSCCSPEYCHITIEYAKDYWNQELKPTSHESLPLMGPKGCIAPPHTRPLCSMHICEHLLWKDQKFANKYMKLREKCGALNPEKLNQ